MVIVRAVILGLLVALAGTLPRNLFFAANLRSFAGVPWAVPVTALYLWFFWRYLAGMGPPEETVAERRESLRAFRVSGRVWALALLAGGLGIVALVLALRVANRLVVLHMGGNLYSNLDLWLHGKAEWQAPSGPGALIWKTGADAPFWRSSLAFVAVAAAMIGAFILLARAVRKSLA